MLDTFDIIHYLEAHERIDKTYDSQLPITKNYLE